MKNSGVSLFEMVIGLAILGIVMAITFQVFSQVLRIYGDQEALVSAQTRIRRVSEVIAQDVRGAVFGGIVNQPIASNNTGFSVALLSGGNGYPVVPYASTALTNISVVGQPEMGGSNYAFLYSNEKGVVLPLSSAPTLSSGSTYTVPLGCPVTLAYSGAANRNTLLFPVRVVGYWLDSTTNTLRYQELGQTAQDVAYNITQFSIDYLYRNPTGGLETNPTGYTSAGGVNLKTADGKVLVRMRVTISAREKSFGTFKIRTYASELSLANNGILNLSGVVKCS